MGFNVQRSKDMDYLFGALTSGVAQVLSDGKIPQMSPEQASGLLGSWIVETGKADLTGLDVVERGNNNAGRGLSQYTGVRRKPYDRAREKAIAQGKDPNSAQWQLQYFVEEYSGKHDPTPGRSLIGWTKQFEKAPKAGTPEGFASYYTGSAAEGKGYFRPGIPHTDKRQDAARQVYQLYAGPDTSSKAPTSLSKGSLQQKMTNVLKTAPKPIQEAAKPAIHTLSIPTTNQ